MGGWQLETSLGEEVERDPNQPYERQREDTRRQRCAPFIHRLARAAGSTPTTVAMSPGAKPPWRGGMNLTHASD